MDSRAEPFAAKGVEVKVWSAEPDATQLVETPGADVMLDDSIGTVTHKLARAMGGPVYWCVWTTVMPDDHVDVLWDAMSGDLSMLSEALFGKKTKFASIDAVRKRATKGAYVCPYAASGHPCRLPPTRSPQSVRFLEDIHGRGAHVVASRAAPEWAGKPEEPDGTEDVLEALANAKPVSARDIGTRKVRAQHLIVEHGTEVEATDLESVYNATQLRGDGIVAATLYRVDGSLTFRALEQAVREKHIDAASVDRTCRYMMKKGVEELHYVVRNELVHGTASVSIDRELKASITLRTETDAVSAMRSVFDNPELVRAVKYVTGSTARVADDVLDVGTSSHQSRHVVSTDGKGGLNHLVTCFNRAFPLLEYRKLENAVEVTMARTPGHVPSTVAETFIARRYFMVTQGRSAELVKAMSSELSMSAEEAQAELAGYLQSKPARDARGVTPPPNGLLGTVTTGPEGFVVTLECTCPLVYADRLLWCLRRCANIGLVTHAADAVDGNDTQAILKRLQESRANGGEDEIKSRYVLQRLFDADPDLFTRTKTPRFKMYSKICGAVDKRQPIAVDAETFASIKDADPDIESVQTRGTTYICPEVWCPATQTTMTAEAFRAAGNMCPGQRKGVNLSDVRYWKGSTGRYPRLLGAEKHPSGMCMPCCFKKNKADVEQSEDPGYVMSETNAPLPEGRFGKAAGMADLLRVGVSSFAFVSALGYCVGSDTPAVVEAIRAVTTIRNMLRLKDLLVRFIDVRHAGLREQKYLQFLTTPAGKDHAKACGVADRKFSKDDPKSVRSLVLYDACEKYKDYVPGGSHSFLLPVVLLAYPAVLVGVFEQMRDGEVVVHTPLGGGRSIAPKHGAMIMKTGNVYEPLVDSKTKAMNIRVDGPYAKAVKSSQVQAREFQGTGALMRLRQELADRGIDVASNVVEGDTLDVAGVLTIDGVFVPLPEPESCTYDMAGELTWYEDLQDVDCRAKGENVIALFKELSESLDWDHLTRFKETRSGGVMIAIVLDNGAIVPLKSVPEARVLWSRPHDALVQFSRIAPASPPAGVDGGVLAMMDAMHTYLMDNHTKEYWVLKHPLCPYPRDVRAERIMELTSPVHGDDVAEDLINRTVNMIMTRQKRPKMKSSPHDKDVLIATEDDVVDGGLSAAISVLAAPADHVDVVRRALSATMDPETALYSPIELAGSWAAPLRGMSMFSSDACNFDSVAAMSAEIGIANPKATRKEYVDAVVRDAVKAVELGDSIDGLGLHWTTKDVVLAEVAKARKARTPLRFRLSRALLLKEDFKMGPGDLSRALSSRNRTAVVVHPSGAYVSGSPPRCVVLALKDDKIFVAKVGDAIVLTDGQLSKGVSKIVAESKGVRTKRA
jgi:hypothetical protein